MSHGDIIEFGGHKAFVHGTLNFVKDVVAEHANNKWKTVKKKGKKKTTLTNFALY